MTLSNEAGYLYSYSKKLTKVNATLRKLTKQAKKHQTKHEKSKKEKHRVKHGKATSEMKKIMKEHNKILAKLRHHQIAFADQLQKQHKI